MATKNGMVTLQINECDMRAILTALNYRESVLAGSPSNLNREKAVEYRHLYTQLSDQSRAQGCK